jgi:hypothetical protein
MSRLELCFPPEETGQRRPLTEDEINQLAVTASGINAIVEVMGEYTCSIQSDNALDAVSNCLDVFTVLEWLIKPVLSYLSEYAGEEAAPDNPETTT